MAPRDLTTLVELHVRPGRWSKAGSTCPTTDALVEGKIRLGVLIAEARLMACGHSPTLPAACSWRSPDIQIETGRRLAI